MTGFFAVVQREIGERRAVVVAAAIAGLFPLAIPALPWLRSFDRGELWGVLAATLAVSFGVAFAILHGATMIGPDLTERRMGFYFARPLSAAAIWGGKIVAGLILVHLLAVLVVLPAALFGSAAELTRLAPLDETWLLGSLSVAALLLILTSHLVSIAIRSRSPLIAVDVAALFGAGGIVWFSLWLLFRAQASDVIAWITPSLVAMLVVVLAIAGYVQVAHGRTDLIRSHRWQSFALCSGLAVLGAAIGGTTTWFLHPAPSDLVGVPDVTLPSRGPWIGLSGSARGRGHQYAPAFLLETTSGRFIRIDRSFWWWSGAVEFSADGARAAWTSPTGMRRDSVVDVMSADLTDSNPGSRRTGITLRRGELLALSGDGSRVALREDMTVSVAEVDGGRILAAIRLPDELQGWFKCDFTERNRLRIVAQVAKDRHDTAHEVVFYRLDVSDKHLSESFRIRDAGRYPLSFLRIDPTGRRILLRIDRQNDRVLRLLDAATGHELRELALWDRDVVGRAEFLVDGRIVVGEAGPSGVRLKLLTSDGELAKVIELGAGRSILVGCEPAPGMLVAGVTSIRTLQWTASDWQGFLVDLGTGGTRRLGRDVVPFPRWAWSQGPAFSVAPGAPASRLLLGPAGTIVQLDPVTATTRAILAMH